MSLFTTHIGFAIRDALQGCEIEGEQASRMDPFADEKHYVEQVDITDASNPVIYTTGGTFKVIILRIDSPAPPPPKVIEHR